MESETDRQMKRQITTEDNSSSITDEDLGVMDKEKLFQETLDLDNG